MKLKPVPEAVTLPPEDDSIERVIEDFFGEARTWIEQKYPIVMGQDFTIRFRPMGHDHAQDHVRESLTDDIARYLTYQDGAVVAAVFATRNDYNNVRYSFFRNLGNIDMKKAEHNQEFRRKAIEGR